MSFVRIAVALGATLLSLEQASAASLHADFNGDGYADLAIGVQDEDIGADADAGAVQVIYGTKKGLTSRGNQLFHQDSPGIKDNAEPDDEFGRSLAFGDFNADGLSDLAVGAPGEGIGAAPYAGVVHILYGTKHGLSANRSQLWHQDSEGIGDTSEEKDYFGNALVTGDFDGDGYSDLAVGAAGETLEPDVPAASVPTAAGIVHLLYGGARGLSAAGSTTWRQGADGVLGVAEPWDHFGASLAATDFDADGYDDLVVGAPHEDDDTNPNLILTGAAHVLRGSVDGITSAGNQLWEQDTPGLAASVESFGVLGAAMATGDFDADGHGDIAWLVRVDVGGAIEAGAVDVLYGYPAGLRAVGHTYLTEDTPGVKGHAVTGDTFGVGIAAGDINGDGIDDLAVGVGETPGGGVQVFYSRPRGLSTVNDYIWTQDSPHVPDTAELGDLFGFSMAR